MVYGSGILVPVARRWAAQLNENAKRAAQWGAMPEMNHNEVVPWVDGGSWADKYTVVLLDDPGAPEDVRKRIPVTRDLAEAAGWKPHVLVPEGDHELTRMLSLAVMGDWLSYWIALAEDTDPTPIPTIEKLKKRLEE